MAGDFAKADERGVPSLVWRAGQERRLEMIRRSAGTRLDGGQVLVDGCGIGMYNRALLKFTPHVFGLDVEADRVRQAAIRVPNLVVSVGEYLPYRDAQFDVILSHEVIEHVQDDRLYAAEMIRVLKPGGRAIIFCPNRWYPFETHGHYWRGEYHFGNTPLINYLPNIWRNKFAPHVRAYTARGLRRLFDGLPVRVISHRQIYPGYDNVVRRAPKLGTFVRRTTYFLERTPLQKLGLSHWLVLEKRKIDG